MTAPSHFTFKIPRYGDLLMDTYLVFSLPNIWSPIYCKTVVNAGAVEILNRIPYEFKWIEDIGTQMIQEITIKVGGQIIQKCTGKYLTTLIKRDFTNTKKNLHDKMSGNTEKYTHPENSYYDELGNKQYPHAYNPFDPDNAEGKEYYPAPSIDGQNIYVPINMWFTQSTQAAFPLIALQYSELTIDVTIRPIVELFTINNVTERNGLLSVSNPKERIRGNNNEDALSFYRFVQPPPSNNPNYPLDQYPDERGLWDTDIHLISTYAFLSDEEAKVFAANEQNYLIKETHEYFFEKYNGAGKPILKQMISIQLDVLFSKI